MRERDGKRQAQAVLWPSLMIRGSLSQDKSHFCVCKVGTLTLSWWKSLDVGWGGGSSIFLKVFLLETGSWDLPTASQYLPPSSWPLIVHVLNEKIGSRTQKASS